MKEDQFLLVKEMKESLKGRSVLVLGYGKSGQETAKLLTSLGTKVSVYDDAPRAKYEDSNDYRFLISKGANFLAPGLINDDVLYGIDLVIQSPGVPYDHPLVTVAMINLIPVWSEIELAYRLIEKPVIGITGTNGKTTTTTLVGEILKRSGVEVFVAGNIGKPLISTVNELNGVDMIVAEISSFQLESIETFAPAIAAFLNITPDHLDRHYLMERYLETKMRIFERQTPDDFAILNFDDERVRGLAPEIRSKVIFFSRIEEPAVGVFVRNGRIVSKIDGEIEICSAQLSMRGVHNLENALAATAVSLCAGASHEAVKTILRDFPGVEHRIEYVTEISGVQFYNDSKGTNPHSTLVALRSFDEPVVLIAGGQEKGTSFDELSRQIKKSCKGVVLIGEASGSIQASLEGIGFKDYRRAETIEDAVKEALEMALKGDVVLLSPACASFDMFENYEERGKLFKESVWSQRS